MATSALLPLMSRAKAVQQYNAIPIDVPWPREIAL